MVAIHPIALSGRWRQGFALDRHIISSTYIGDNEYGHPMFDTKRTDIGELMYRLKYGQDESVVNDVADAAADFVRSWNPGVSLVVPAPASKTRAKQPVVLLARAIGERLSIPVEAGCITRTGNLPQLKNVREFEERLRLLQGVHTVDQSVVKDKRVLLLDDVFQSGATLNATTESLYHDGRASDVFALTVTVTK